jgi:hypothetical protein
MKIQILILLSMIVLATQGQYAPLYIQERGTTFLQENYKDTVNNLMISIVPAHNDRVHSKWIYDLGTVSQYSTSYIYVTALFDFIFQTGLMMQVIEKSRTCTIENAIFNASQLVDAFDYMNNIQENTSYNEPLEAMGPNTITKNLVFMVSDESMPHSFLPEKFQEHCPPGFEVFAAHTYDPDQVTAENPYMLKDITNMTHEKDFYDYVPPSMVPHVRRRRAPCQTVDRQIVPNCHLVDNECDSGLCEVPDMRFWCRPTNNENSDSACTYILSDCIKEDRTTKIKCIFHIASGNQMCHACCMNKNCGGVSKCPARDRQYNYQPI